MSKLTPQQRALLQRFGLTGTDAARNEALIASQYAREERGSNANRAVRLARALHSGTFGTRAAAPRRAVNWRGTLGTASKAEYDRRVAAAKVAGDAARAVALRNAYRSRRREGRAAAMAALVARKARLTKIRRNTARGPRSFAVDPDKARMVVNVALTRLTGVLQDLMALSGVTLAGGVHYAVAQFAGAGARAGVAAAVRLTPAALLRWVAVGVLRRYGVTADDAVMQRVMSRAKSTILAILANRNVDVRPLVSAVVMSIDSGDVETLASQVVRDVLDQYVYARYVPSGGDGMMCRLCSQAGCARPTTTTTTSSAANKTSAARLAALLSKAFRSVNDLLSLDPRKLTITKVLRQVVDTYLDANMRLALRATGAVPGLPTFVAIVATPLYPVVNKAMRAYGLGIDFADFRELMWRDFASVRAFVNSDFSRSIEPLLLSLVAKARPVALLRGAAGTALGGRSTGEFCTLCRSAYQACTR